VRNLAHDGGDFVQPRALRCTPTTFAGDQLKAIADWAKNQRLNDSAGFDGTGELIESLLAETRARLIRARLDQIDIDLLRAGRNWLACRSCCGAVSRA